MIPNIGDRISWTKFATQKGEIYHGEVIDYYDPRRVIVVKDDGELVIIYTASYGPFESNANDISVSFYD